MVHHNNTPLRGLSTPWAAVGVCCNIPKCELPIANEIGSDRQIMLVAELELRRCVFSHNLNVIVIRHVESVVVVLED